MAPSRTTTTTTNSRIDKKPVIVRQVYVGRSPNLLTTSAENGFGCCGVCRVCTCLRWGVLATPTGVIKAGQVILGFFVVVLLQSFGVQYKQELGLALAVALTTSSAAFLASAVLLFCYVASETALQTLRPTLFEVLFNLVCSLLYLSTAFTLTFSVHKNLFFYYNTIPGFHAYPAMTVTYMLEYLAGVLHGIDSLVAWRAMRT